MSKWMPGGMIAGLVGEEDGPPMVNVERVYRRTVVLALIVAGLVAVAAAIAGYGLIGIGALLGVVLAGINNLAFQRKTLKILGEHKGVEKKPIASSVVTRLVVVTAVAFYFVYALPQLGWGILGGLGLFQFALLSTAVGTLSKARKSS